MKATRLINGLLLATGLLAGAVSAAPASKAAAATPSIEISTVMQKVFTTTDAKGAQHKQAGPVDKVVPGDELVYSFPTHNVGKQPATDVVVTNKVPEHMTYVPGSADGQGAEVSFSIDGGKTWGKPEELTVHADNGTTMTAQAKDYTNIRWVIKQVAAGDTVVVSYHAVLQ